MALSMSFDGGAGRPSGKLSADGEDSSRISEACAIAITILGIAGAFAIACFGVASLEKS